MLDLSLPLALLLALHWSFSSAPAVQRLAVGKTPVAVAISDLNHDGFQDIIVANDGDGTLTVLLGNGKGAFRPAPGSPFAAGEHPADLAVADFDGDGHLDVAIANHSMHYVTVLFGDGRGRLGRRATVPVRSNPHPHGIAAGDWNGDGRIDLAIDSWAEDKLEILVNDGGGKFHSDTMIATGRHPYERLRSADLDRDGRPDLFVADFEGGDVTILLNQGGGRWKAATRPAVPPNPFAIAACDVNGDGHLDLVTAHYSGQLADRSRDAIAVLLGDGKGHFHLAPGSPFHSGAAPVAIVCADLDGDGFDDVATANLGGNSVTLLPGGRQHMGTPRDIAVGSQPELVAAGSLLGGKRQDLVTADSRDDRVTVLSFR
jgi:hypothetical protein